MPARQNTACIALAVSVLAGCSGGTSVLTPTGTIPIRVWIVLDAGETVGQQSNNGCRLTSTQMTAFVRQLQSDATMFGANIMVTWTSPSTPTVIEDGDMRNFADRQYPIEAFSDEGRGGTLANNYDPNKVNIYFFGNSYLQQNGAQFKAVTVDPRDAATPCIDGNTRPFILINDGGGTSGSGFLTGRSPAQSLVFNLLQHEMAHFLGRFSTWNTSSCTTSGRSIAATGSVYNSGEHDQTGGSPAFTRDNVLKSGEVGVDYPSYPLTVPGDARLTTVSEAKEISDRITQGRVLLAN